MKKTVSKLSNSHGQATIEIILLMNVFVAVVLIIFNIFLITYNQLVVIESANEGARYAATIWHDSKHRNDRIKLSTNLARDILKQKLKNAVSGKPQIYYKSGAVSMKTSCRYKISIPVIDGLMDTEINLEHTSTYNTFDNFTDG